MAIISWRDDLSTGVRQSDSDHQKLIALINELHDAMLAGKAKDVLGPILDKLITYTKLHFASEERMMLANNYPGYITHKKEHDHLTKTVLDLQAKFKDGSGGLTTNVFNFLKGWLVNHIQGTDQKYGPYLNAKGIR